MEQSLIYQISCLLGIFFSYFVVCIMVVGKVPQCGYLGNMMFFLSFLRGCFFASAGKNCCFNSSSVDFFFEFEPHPSSAKNLRHLFQSMPCASSLAVIYVNTFCIWKFRFHSHV